MTLQTRQPTEGEFGGLQIPAGGGLCVTRPMIPAARHPVKPRAALGSSGTTLLDQALAAAEKAESTAAWHSERAVSYLRWVDTPWAARRYAEHCDAAEFQRRIAARHRAVAAALQGGRP